LNAYFPLAARSNKQRGALTNHYGAASQQPEKQQQQQRKRGTDALEVADIPPHVQELVQRQKEAVRKRHELLLLPSRG
jgi:hypothetical protein